MTDDIDKGVAQADIIYTDVWVSMGEEAAFKERIDLLLPYQVNQTLMEKTQKAETIFLHCLPAFHDQGGDGSNIRKFVHSESIKYFSRLVR